MKISAKGEKKEITKIFLNSEVVMMTKLNGNMRKKCEIWQLLNMFITAVMTIVLIII